MTDITAYDADTALDAFYTGRNERSPARLWAIETEMARLQAIGQLEYFSGPGPDPTTLSGYASDKLWLRTNTGVTPTSGAVRRWSGTSPASNDANWIALNRTGYLAHLGESSDDASDLITNNTTLNVPATYATIAVALAYLAQKQFAAGVTVTIQVADGTYTNSGTEFTHPQGNQIQLIGDTTTPGNCILRSTSGVDAIAVRNGFNLGLIDGFRIENTGTKGGHGILAEFGSYIGVGNVEIDNFYYGVAAKLGGSISGDGTSGGRKIYVTDAGDVGIWAFVGASISCRYAVVDGSIDAASNLGFGIMGEYGSSIDCQYAETMNCHRSGIASYSASAVRAYNSNSHDNTTHGYEAVLGGSLTAHSGTSSGNGAYGASHDFNSIIFSSPAIAYSGNVSGNFDGGYILTSSGASLRFNSNGPEIKYATTNVLTLRDAALSEKMRFDLANNRFGIGTTSPSTDIEVLKAASSAVVKARTATSGNASFELDHATNADFGIVLFRQGGTEFGRIQHTNSGDLYVGSTTNLFLRTASTVRMSFDSSGIMDYKQAAVTAGAPFTNTGKVAVKINGTSYNLMLCA